MELSLSKDDWQVVIEALKELAEGIRDLGWKGGADPTDLDDIADSLAEQLG